MTIKHRLVKSYIAVLILPILLSAFATWLMGMYYIGDMTSIEQLNFRAHPLKEARDQRATIFAEVRSKLLKNQNEIDESVFNVFEDRLKGIYSTAVIRKGGDAIFIGGVAENHEIIPQLPSFGRIVIDEYEVIRLEGRNYWVRQHDFIFSDGAEGSLFIITNVNSIMKSLKGYNVSIFITVILILIFTNGLLSYVMSRSITRPIDKLKSYANSIKEGNLDFKIEIETMDEIGELSMAFEEMRYRLKQSLELQLQYENDRKELISSISHDLKTPITAIKGYVEGIIDGVADSPEKNKKYMQTIYSKATDIDKMIDELFLFSKLDLRKLTFHFKQVDIMKYLVDCVEELQFDLEKKDVILDLIMEEASIIVMADPEKLKRVIVNVIDNAIKNMDKESPKIQIKAYNNEENVTLSIKDNGKGIPERAIPYIFETFYRADASRNVAYGGSGLGLAIAKRIIVEHGGNIWAESVEGQYTTIFITLKKIKRGDSIEKNFNY